MEILSNKLKWMLEKIVRENFEGAEYLYARDKIQRIKRNKASKIIDIYFKIERMNITPHEGECALRDLILYR